MTNSQGQLENVVAAARRFGWVHGIAALFGVLTITFFLPWLSVSFAGKPVAAATGWGIASGNLAVRTTALSNAEIGIAIPWQLRIAAAMTLLCSVLGIAVSRRAIQPGSTVPAPLTAILALVPAGALAFVVVRGEPWVRSALQHATVGVGGSIASELAPAMPEALSSAVTGLIADLAVEEIHMVPQPAVWLALIASAGVLILLLWEQHYARTRPRRGGGVPRLRRSCPSCGALATRDAARFCNSCGAQLKSAS